jgi:hypothetical protein
VNDALAAARAGDQIEGVEFAPGLIEQACKVVKTFGILQPKRVLFIVDRPVLAVAAEAGSARLRCSGVPSLRVFLCIGGWLGVVGDAVSEVDA